MVNHLWLWWKSPRQRKQGWWTRTINLICCSSHTGGFVEYLYYFELKRSIEKGLLAGLLLKCKLKGQEKTPGKHALKSPCAGLCRKLHCPHQVVCVQDLNSHLCGQAGAGLAQAAASCPSVSFVGVILSRDTRGGVGPHPFLPQCLLLPPTGDL